jgi:adenylate kinase
MAESPDLKNVENEALFSEVKRRFECSFKPSKRVVLAGPAGSGKGTQAEKLSQENCWCWLSTGDLLREQVAKGTELGLKAKVAMNAGGLVSDDIVIGMIREQVKRPYCSRGVIFDGFPRTKVQAEALDEMLGSESLKIDKAIEFQIPDEVLVGRITGRRAHLPSGRTYHVTFKPPRVPDLDDVTGEPLTQRKDDTEEVLKKRLDQYHSNTNLIFDYYRQKSVYAGINANQSIPKVWEDLSKAV